MNRDLLIVRIDISTPEISIQNVKDMFINEYKNYFVVVLVVLDYNGIELEVVKVY